VRCFVVAGFLLTSASRGPSAIAEPLVSTLLLPMKANFYGICQRRSLRISVSHRGVDPYGTGTCPPIFMKEGRTW